MESTGGGEVAAEKFGARARGARCEFCGYGVRRRVGRRGKGSEPLRPRSGKEGRVLLPGCESWEPDGGEEKRGEKEESSPEAIRADAPLFGKKWTWRAAARRFLRAVAGWRAPRSVRQGEWKGTEAAMWITAAPASLTPGRAWARGEGQPRGGLAVDLSDVRVAPANGSLARVSPPAVSFSRLSYGNE
ncbi:hypothetical protein MTO96_024959 [Rhipicephalus appendiculatus]